MKAKGIKIIVMSWKQLRRKKRNVVKIPLVTCFLLPQDGSAIGDKHYLVYSILQARSRNPDIPIFVITNGIFSHPLGEEIHVITPKNISDLDRDFVAIYKHRSTVHKPHYMSSAFRRLFLIRDLMRAYKIDRCFHFESDVFLYANVEEAINHFDAYELAFCVGGQSNAGALLINDVEMLEKLLQLILSYYKSENSSLIEYFDCADVTEMHFLSYFLTKNSAHIGNLSFMRRSGFFDLSIHQIRNQSNSIDSLVKMFPGRIQVRVNMCKMLYAKKGNIYCHVIRQIRIGKRYIKIFSAFYRLYSIHAGSNEKWLSQYYAVDFWPEELKSSLTSKTFINLIPERRYFEARLHLIGEFRDINKAAELANSACLDREQSSFISEFAKYLSSRAEL